MQIVEDIRTAISAGSVTNTMEAQVLEYCVSVLGRRIEETGQSGYIENLPDVVAFLAGISPSATLKALLEGITDAVEVINANIGNGYVYAGIATPSGTPVSGKVFYLAKQAGQYANFGGLTVTEGVNILKRNGSTWTQEQLLSMADIRKNPLIGYYECDTAGDTSAKTVTAAGYVLPATGGSVKIKMANRNTVANATLNINSTGAKPLYYNGRRAGVGNTWDTNEIIEVFYDGAKYQAYNVAGCNGDGVFDISVHNPANGLPTPYPDLKTALGTDGEHVPQSLRKGGMSVKFIQGNTLSPSQNNAPNSDNKYVQYRCLATSFSTNVADWQEEINGVAYKEDDNYLYVLTDEDKKLLMAFEKSGSVIFGEGVPKQIVQNYGAYIEDENFLLVTTDASKHILLGIRKDGTLVCNDIESPLITSILKKIEGSGAIHSLKVQNSDKIAIIGDSFTESAYCIKEKAYIQKLSLFSDYVFSNYGVSGDTYAGRMYAIRSKEKRYGDIPLDEQGIKYAMLACYGNDIKYMSVDDYIKCTENIIEFVKGIGMSPIVCTEYNTGNTAVNKTAVRTGLKKLAENHGVPFYDIASIVDMIIGNSKYTPFWGGSHPGTRSNAIESDNYEKYLSALERPMKSLKLFRARNNSYSSLDEYMFHSVENRAKLFKEILVGSRDLSNSAYVDDCSGSAMVGNNSEYQTLAQKGAVPFGNVSLISAVLSTDSSNLTSLALNITHTSDSLHVYVRDTLVSPYPTPTRYSSFYVSYEIEPAINSTYRCEEDGQTYTVKAIVTDEGGQKNLLCLPFVPSPALNTGTLTKLSGTGDSTLTYTHRERGMDVNGLLEDTLGHWAEVTADTDGSYNLGNKPNCIDVDRVDILLVSSNAYNITDVELTYTGEEKVTHKGKEFVFETNYYNSNTEMLPSNTFGTIGVLDTNWNVTPTNTYEGLHGTNVFPVGCSSKVNVDSVNKLSCNISASKTGEAVLEVWCRYFPDVYTNGSGNQITEDSYDYSDLIVSMNGVNMRERVNTHWKIVRFPVALVAGSHSISFSSDKGLEISYVSLKFKN